MANARQAKSTREKAAALRLEQERAAARRRNITVAVSTVVVLVVLIGAYALIRTAKNQQDAKNAEASKPPTNLFTTTTGVEGYLYDSAISSTSPSASPSTSPSASGSPSTSASPSGSASTSPSASPSPSATRAATAGKGTAKTTVVVYEDFLCPVCKQFEEADGAALRSYADEGKINLVYRPVAILASRTSTDYSTRAAAAFGAVVNAAPDRVSAFHDALFASQPEEGSAGLPDTQLVDMAVQAGVAKDKIEKDITQGTYKGWATKGTDDFTKKYTGTPTVLINGNQVKSLDAATLKAELDKAIG